MSARGYEGKCKKVDIEFRGRGCIMRGGGLMSTLLRLSREQKGLEAWVGLRGRLVAGYDDSWGIFGCIEGPVMKGEQRVRDGINMQ